MKTIITTTILLLIFINCNGQVFEHRPTQGTQLLKWDRAYILDSLYNIEDSLLELLNECRSGKLKASYIRGNKYRGLAKEAIQMTNSTPIKKEDP